MIKQTLGVESRKATTLAVAAVVVTGGLWFTYATGRISIGTLVLLAALAVALAVVTVVFVGRMNDPDESVEQMLYKTDHPTRRSS
ncbi:MAG TPA: hypothetical protein VG871_23995 [Vicinamibacterales bacterium]|nr:hypothetical protein [Vicinamibacterales bacterium]